MPADGARRQRATGVVDRHVQLSPSRCASTCDVHRVAAALHAMFEGVLEQRLQQQRGDAAVERIVGDIPVERDAAREALLHDLRVQLAAASISSRSEVMWRALACRLARSRSASRVSRRSARSTSTCMSAEMVLSALNRKCGCSCALSCASCDSARCFCSASSCSRSWRQRAEALEPEDDAEPQRRRTAAV